MQRSKVISSFESPKFTQNAVTEFEWEVKSLKEQLEIAADLRITSPHFGIQGTELQYGQAKVWLSFHCKDPSRYILQLRAMEYYSVIIDTKFSCQSVQETKKETFKQQGGGFWNILTIPRGSELGRAIEELNAFIILIRITTIAALGQPTNTKVEDNALIVPPVSTLASTLQASLTSGKFTDITLKSQAGDSFQAHRQLLAMRSPVFEAMFYGQMREAPSGTACIDASSDGIQHLLSFIYTDAVEDEAVEKFGSELYELGIQYELPRLAALVKEQFLRTLSVDNVCERLTLAVRFSLEELERRCKLIIQSNLSAVMNTKGWLHVAQDASVMRMLMSCDTFQYESDNLSPRKLKRPRLDASLGPSLDIANEGRYQAVLNNRAMESERRMANSQSFSAAP